MTFYDIAKPLAEQGIPVIRLRPKSKIAIDSDWPSLATANLEIIKKWSDESPDCNVGCVAQAVEGGIWMFELDAPEVVQRILNETGNKLPSTLRVRSRPGRGHVFFRHNAESLSKISNMAQGFVKNSDFSVRASAQYCVGAGSIHPITSLPYEVVCNAPIAECPPWFINWVNAQRIEKKNVSVEEAGPIPDGARNSTLTSLAGKLRNIGLSREDIESQISKINSERCQPPLSESEISTIAASVSRYPIGRDSTVLVGGQPVGSAAPRTAYGVQPAQMPEELAERPVLPVPTYPVFPRWVFSGTSIYEGLVKPYCDVNSRYPEYMFLPAMTLLLNFVATKVQIKGKLVIPSIFMVLIGKRGVVIKSSSVESAIEYFRYAGMIDHANGSMDNANSKALVWEIGSPEGLGIEMSRLKCKNGILFFDELATLSNKAGIEGSTLTSRLLALYESGKFQNTIKAKRDSFSFEPNTYCVSLIACATDKNFLSHWSKLSGKSSGLDDRFMFLFQPKELIPLTPHVHVNTQQAAMETRRRVDLAIQRGVFEFSNTSPLSQKIAELGNRAEIRAEKFALGFAIDLGLDEISEECVERALAIVEYEQQVKKWLVTYDATTKEGSIQMEIRTLLVRNQGSMSLRDMRREVHADRHGTTLWGQAYGGLLKNGIIREEGSGRKNDPKIVVLLEALDEYED